MTTEVKVCGVCGKNEMSVSCEVCGVPLCAMCLRTVVWQEATLSAQVKPGVFLSPLRPGILLKKVCATCMREAEFYDGEYY